MYQNIYVNTNKNEAWVWDDEKGLMHFNYTPYAYKKDPSGKYISIHGDKLSKVTDFHKNDPDLLESDVPETTRILVDMYGDSDAVSTGHNVVTFDIEVEMITGTPDPSLGNNEITSIAVHDGITSEYTVFVLDKKNRLENEKKENVNIVSCANEKTLLLKFLDLLEEIKPTIFTGWNINKFDIPYLYNRIKRVLGKKAAHRLSPIGFVFYSPYRDTYSIGGISTLDYMVVYKKFSYKELPSYSLDYVSKLELGRGKVEYEGNLDELMESDIDTFIKYNVVDCDLIIELDEKLQFIDLIRGICHVGHVPYEDFIYSSKYLEGALLTYLKRLGAVAPNKPADRKERMQELIESGEDGFIGAFVKEPVPGRYEWMYDLDLTSLYPSIIMSLNISPETKLTKIMDWDADEFIRGDKDTYILSGEEVSKDKLQRFLEKYNYTVASNGVIYRTDINGIIPSILNEWFDKRVEYKNQMKKYGKEGNDEKYVFYKKRQLVQKILLNSLYGVLGLPAFRFYDIDNAEAVTLTGQTVIKKTQDVINMKYNKELDTGDTDYVQYVDTDSVFLSCLPLVKNRFPDADFDDQEWMTKKIYEIAGEVQTYVNKFYDVFAKKFFNANEHRFEIKQEKIGKMGFWQSKKRYAMWVISDNGVPKDEIEVVGLDVVRSSFPVSFQKHMKKVLGDILKDESKDTIDQSIISFEKSVKQNLYAEIAKTSAVKNIKKWEEPTKSMVLGKFVSGTPAHVKAAINYNKLLKHFKCPGKYAPMKNGDKIKWIYLKDNKFGLDQVAFKGESDPPKILEFIQENFDATKIYKKELEKKLQAFYEALKWDYPSASMNMAKKFFDF